MAEYNFETYPTDPETMSEYLHERQAQGNPMTRNEAEGYIAWNTATVEGMSARVERMKTVDGSGQDELRRLDEAMGVLFDMEDARFEVEAVLEAAEDAERAAEGKRPLQRERDITAFGGFSGMGATPRGW